MTERILSYESLSSPDFLSEKITIRFDIAEEAAHYLPEVSSEDLKTRREKYGILLGTWNQEDSENVRVRLEAVLEVTEDDPGGKGHYYTEDINEVHNINLSAIKNLVEATKRANPEFAHLELIGDIHTHPVLPHSLREDQHPSDMSDGDYKDLMANYQRGDLTSQHPFIVGIAGPDENGETSYAFWRLIKRDNKFIVGGVDTS